MPTPADKWSIERYRPLLRLQARKLELDMRLRRRFDSSDLVQETLLKAHAALDTFAGASEAELVRWLQGILGNVLVDEVRAARAQKRDVELERSIDEYLAASSARLEAFLTAGGPSPSEQAERQEQLLRLGRAIEHLPDEQRDVVVLRDLLGTPIREISEQLGRTEKSVAGLLLRGRRRLRELLEAEE
jgi:RNA polymerase sigma-70 factor (ECF subfamily)